MPGSDTLQTGGLLAALLACFKLLEVALTRVLGGKDAPQAPQQAWWERLGKLDAECEALKRELTDLRFVCSRLEASLDRLRER